MEDPPNSAEKRKTMKMIEEPLLETSNSELGGLSTIPYIMVNEAFEKTASYGLTPNMILYLMKVYHLQLATGNYILYYWSAATNFMPVLGAFLADSFFGRFPMIGVGSIFSFLGMTLLWLTTMIPQARPPPCSESSSDSCSSPTTFQIFVLCCCFGLISIGAGGIRSSSTAFGADQLVEKNKKFKNEGVLERYFSWYAAFTSLSVVMALTLVVYIQDHLGWKVGFGVPMVLMFISAFSFFLASSLYIKLKPKSSLLTSFFQVIVASYKNRNLEFPSPMTNMVYHVKKGSMLIVPSEKLRFLNKACIIQQDLTVEERVTDPWSVCTVDEVEDLKALLKVIPLWSTGVIMSIDLYLPSFQVLQASSMDRHLTPWFEIPAASFGMFSIISIILWVALYDRLILPLASKIVGKPVHFTAKQRMGAGIFLSVFSMVMTGIVEYFRRGIAFKDGVSDDPEAIVNMSAMWLILPNFMSGVTEAVSMVGQNEFYFGELPRSMSSIATTLQLLGMSAASLIASLIMNTIDNVTKSGGGTSWVASNINKAHYDYYAWVMAGLSAVNVMYFILCSWAYGPCQEVIRFCDDRVEVRDN